MLVKIEARILIFPGTDFHFPSTSVPPGTFFRLCHATNYCRMTNKISYKMAAFLRVLSTRWRRGKFAYKMAAMPRFWVFYPQNGGVGDLPTRWRRFWEFYPQDGGDKQNVNKNNVEYILRSLDIKYFLTCQTSVWHFSTCQTTSRDRDRESSVIRYCRLTNYELLRWLVETPSRDFAHYRLSGGRPDML